LNGKNRKRRGIVEGLWTREELKPKRESAFYGYTFTHTQKTSHK